MSDFSVGLDKVRLEIGEIISDSKGNPRVAEAGLRRLFSDEYGFR